MARASRFPDDGTGLPRAVRDLQRTVRELAAAPRGANTSISGGGGLSLVGAGGQVILLTPTSPLGVTLPDGSVIYPPAVALRSAVADLVQGGLTTYRRPTVLGSVPVAELVSPQAGPTTARLRLQGGEDGGETALAQLVAAGATLTLTPSGLTVTLADGSALVFTSAGVTAPGDIPPGWAEDPANRTSTSTTYGDASSGAFSASVTVPPTGRVIVELRCTQRASGTGINAITSWRAVGSSTGTVYTENDTAALIVGGAANVSLSLRHLLTGLIPGETLTATTKHRLSTTGTQTLAYRSILLEP